MIFADGLPFVSALLYMHRGFFAKAMTDNPVDPLSGKYGHSVLRAYESASFFVQLVKSLWMQHRQLTERNWFLFTHVFSCAVSFLSTIENNMCLISRSVTRLFWGLFRQNLLGWPWLNLRSGIWTKHMICFHRLEREREPKKFWYVFTLRHG